LSIISLTLQVFADTVVVVELPNLHLAFYDGRITRQHNYLVSILIVTKVSDLLKTVLKLLVTAVVA
jgi:hypothetical protein